MLAVMLSEAKHPRISPERTAETLREVYPEPLLPLRGIRAVRKLRANGLRVTAIECYALCYTTVAAGGDLTWAL